MFNWLKNLLFGKPAQKVKTPATTTDFENRAVLLSESPYIESIVDPAPKPKKKRYYKPKTKKTETPAPANEAKPRKGSGPKSR